MRQHGAGERIDLAEGRRRPAQGLPRHGRRLDAAAHAQIRHAPAPRLRRFTETLASVGVAFVRLGNTRIVVKLIKTP